MRKKCLCKSGFFLDKTKSLPKDKCQKCRCSFGSQQCFGSATNCNEAPFYGVDFRESNAVVDSVCLVDANTIDSTYDESKLFLSMVLADG